MNDLAKRLSDDWKNQPLSISLTVVALIVSVVLSQGKDWQLGPNLTPTISSFAIYLALISTCALFCRVFFSKSLIALFSISIVLASCCMVLFSTWEKEHLLKSSRVTEFAYQGPIIDLIYWAAFLVFLTVCAGSAISRIVRTYGSTEITNAQTGEKSESGVTFIELLIVAAIWGSFLSGAQQRILEIFVFEGVKKPVIETSAEP